ncbi:MAG: helix-turn-helix transcriptional regulator [Ruminococcaceae bacterium]|nr:helix-turn-helix transcriptional regulator [Oscillospiraceae bacterium]
MNYFQRLRDIRHDRDLTQAQVAEILQIGQSDYSKYERGVNMMGVDKYMALAKFYNISLDYLTGLTDTPKTLDGSPYSYKTKNK